MRPGRLSFSGRCGGWGCSWDGGWIVLVLIIFLIISVLQDREEENDYEKENEWVTHHDEVANATLMMRTNSWYTGANIEGKPRRLLSYIGGVGNYRKFCDEAKASGYAGFELA